MPASKYTRGCLALVVFIVALFASTVLANTEIRNFRVGDVDSGRDEELKTGKRGGLGLIMGWEKLNASANERSFRVRPARLGTPLGDVCELPHVEVEEKSDEELEGYSFECPNELWLELELRAEEWKWYSAFTIRLSWPAFYPTDYDIALYTPEELEAFVHRIQTLSPSSTNAKASPLSEKRLRYARIRLVDTGVRVPSKQLSPSPSDSVDSEEVPFTVILEPLLFGVLPLTVVPTILFLIPLLGGVALAFPYVMRYLEAVAVEARRELYGEKAKAL